jgi:hypothetical protein
MNRKSFFLGLLFSALLSLLLGCIDLTNEPDTPLLQMLRSVPDNRDNRTFVTYGDAALWHESWEVPRIADLDELEDLDEDERQLWLFVLADQTIPPPTLGLQYLMSDDMADFYGFDFFDTDRFLYAGSPPDDLTIVTGSFDLDEIADALDDLDYDHDELVEGVTLYSLLDDYEVNLEAPSRIGRLGELNRIVLQENQIMIARADDVINDAADAQAGEDDSLADNEEFAAAAIALTAPELVDLGDLVGVIFMERDDFADPDSYAEFVEDAILAEMNYDDALPDFELAVFATFHREGKTALALLLILDEDDNGAETAEILGDRLRDYISVVTGRDLDDYWDYEDDFSLTVNDRPVAVAIMEVDDPDLDDSRAFVFNWYRLIVQRDLYFLVVD